MALSARPGRRAEPASLSDRARVLLRHHAEVLDPAVTDGDRPRRGENRRLLTKLAVVGAVMFGFGFALVPFYEQICEVTGIRNLLQPDAPRQHAGRHRAHGHRSSSTRTRTTSPWNFKPRDAQRPGPPGRARDRHLRGRERARPAGHRPGDAELRAAARGAVLQEDGVLLLPAADARAGRSAADAGRVRGRSGAARRTSTRSRCRTRSSKSPGAGRALVDPPGRQGS